MNTKELRECVRLILGEAHGGMTGAQFLQMVDDAPGHAMPVEMLSDAEVAAAEKLVKAGLLRHVPAGHGVSTSGGTPAGRLGMAVTGGHQVATPVDPRVAHRYPERYVLTSAGSHGTGTFAHDKLRDELPRRR